MAPASCTNSKYAIKRVIKVMPTINNGNSILMNLWLDIKDIGVGLSNSDNFKYALTTNSNSCDKSIVKSGNFKNKSVGDKVELFNDIGFNKTGTFTYYLYVWLDEAETSLSTVNQSFDLSLNGECTDEPEAKTYVVYNEEDTTLRIFKRDNDESQVNNTGNRNSVSTLENNRNNYNLNEIDDLTISEEDKLYYDLENRNFSSEEQLPWYSYRDSITKIIIEDEIHPKSTAFWFKDMKNVTYVDLSKLDTSRVTDMTYMFSGMSSLTSLDVGHFNTSNVTTMYHMFDGMSSLTSLDLSNFNTSNVTNMSTMFQNCSKIKILDLSNFDTSNVTIMHLMFYGMSSLINLNISSFNTSKVTSMYGMFAECISLTKLNLNHFDTSNVTSTYIMFSGMTSLESLNIDNFNTSKVIDMNYMFQNCRKIQNLNLNNFNTSNVTDMNRMFSNMTSLAILNLSNFDTSKVTNTEKMFRGCTKLKDLNLSNANFSNVTLYTDMFLDVPNESIIVVKDATQQNWISNKFTNLTNITIKS